MRIAIDLTPIPKQMTGVGKYAQNLVKSLAEYDRKNHYWIFIKGNQYQDFDPNRNNFHIIHLSNILHNIPIRILWEQLVLPLHLYREKIDILHSIHYTSPLLAPCKRVITFHDMIFYLFPEKHTNVKRAFFHSVIPLSIKKATRLIAISENTKSDIQEIFDISLSKIDVIYVTIDSIYHTLRDIDAISHIKKKYEIQDKFILYVGTLEPRKNIPRLIQAYRKLILENKIKHQLVIVGKKGWSYQEIFNMVERLDSNVRKKVIFTGYVPEEELPLLYNAADLFVYPSLYEGFGIPPLEAMACGVPVIVSNVSSLPEVVGYAGILVDPYNVEELCQAIYKVIVEKGLREVLKKKGFQRAQEFSKEKLAKKMLKIYKKVLEG